MAWTDYNEFIGTARELYDFDLESAREYYREVREDLGYTPTVEHLYAYPDAAASIAEDVWEEFGYEEVPESVPEGYEDEYFDYVETYGEEPPDEYWDYDLDDTFYDDDWAEPGEEIEITAEDKYRED